MKPRSSKNDTAASALVSVFRRSNMARLRDVRERVHQPRYDTLVRGIGRSSVNNGAALFGNANVKA
jgi:hypothetical protein